MAEDPVVPLLHIGYHKTATTWLQQDLFQEASGSFCAPWSRTDEAARLIAVNPFAFDPAETAAFFDEGVRTASERGLVPVLSNEQLAGNAHTGGHNSRAVADRLAAAFPRARILIVIREQRSMVMSVYKQYVRACGVASLARYLNPPRRGNDRGVPFFDPSFLEFHRLIAYYVALFGKSNVLVLAFEALKADPEQFVARVTRFAGAPAPQGLSYRPRNTTVSAATLAVKRPVNLLLVRDALNPLALVESPPLAGKVKAAFDRGDRWVPAPVRQRSDERMRRAIDRFLGDRYAASNRVTAELTGLDLAGYGYPV